MTEIVISKVYIFNSNNDEELETTDIMNGSVAYDVYTNKKYVFYVNQWYEISVDL